MEYDNLSIIELAKAIYEYRLNLTNKDSESFPKIYSKNVRPLFIDCDKDRSYISISFFKLHGKNEIDFEPFFLSIQNNLIIITDIDGNRYTYAAGDDGSEYRDQIFTIKKALLNELALHETYAKRLQ